jgi:sugar/nucleoside kinase (ribokinase family)
LGIQGDQRMSGPKAKSHLNRRQLRYVQLIGTGGIGTGMFLLLEGDHTIGRNESRAAKLVPYKDYCKLHIISHYVTVLLGAQRNGEFKVCPIGKVGDDEPGRRLLEEMEKAGMQTEFVRIINGSNTLFSVCFQYPDSTGGNITTSNGASDQVSPSDIRSVFNGLQVHGQQTIVLAVPEVPLSARIELLREGRNEGTFNVTSLLASEIDAFEQLGGFQLTDYLSINIDEAKAVAGIVRDSVNSVIIVQECMRKLASLQEQMSVSVTDGPHGSYGYFGGMLEYVPPLRVKAVGTGGAGDAFLAGTLAGLTCGLPFLKGKNDKEFGGTPLESALELGTLVASLSVTSPDTIHQLLDAETVRKHALNYNIPFTDRFANLFP